MTPEQLCKAGTEHGHQMALFCWAHSQLSTYPELRWLYAIPNGGQRNIIVAASLKAEGVKAGVSDVCLPVAKRNYFGFYLEMKKPGGKESKEQIAFGEFLKTQNYFYTCCDTWEKARDALLWYLGETLEPEV